MVLLRPLPDLHQVLVGAFRHPKSGVATALRRPGQAQATILTHPRTVRRHPMRPLQANRRGSLISQAHPVLSMLGALLQVPVGLAAHQMSTPPRCAQAVLREGTFPARSLVPSRSTPFRLLSLYIQVRNRHQVCGITVTRAHATLVHGGRLVSRRHMGGQNLGPHRKPGPNQNRDLMPDLGLGLHLNLDLSLPHFLPSQGP